MLITRKGYATIKRSKHTQKRWKHVEIINKQEKGMDGVREQMNNDRRQQKIIAPECKSVKEYRLSPIVSDCFSLYTYFTGILALSRITSCGIVFIQHSLPEV